MGVRVGLVLASACCAASCHWILGIEDTQVGASGDGGVDAALGPDASRDFTVAILPASVTVPFGGQSFVEVEVTRLGGFDQVVTLSAPTPPNPSGLAGTATVVAAGESRVAVPVGAMGGLSLGTNFTLTVRGTSGALVHDDDVPAVVTGRPGALDTTFGTNGIFQMNPGSDGGPWVGMHLVGDDVLVIGQRMSALGPVNAVAAKITEDGALDPSWNSGAIVTTQWCSCTGDVGEFSAVGVQTTGLYSVGIGSRWGTGSNQRDIALIRYSPSGGPGGVEFGNSGKNLIDLAGSEDFVASGLVLPDDRIVAVGHSNNQHMIALLDRQGYLDPTFNGSGFAVNGAATIAWDVAADSSNRLVVVSDASSDAQVLRYTLAGVLDGGFDGDGIARVGTPAFESASAVAVYPNGRILVAGATDANGQLDFFLARLLEDGSPDPSFGTEGVAARVITPDSDTATDVLLLADGRIVVIGTTNDGTSPGPAVARYLDDGRLDPSFGTGGVERPFVGADGRLQRIIASPDQRHAYLTGSSSSFPELALILRMWM